MAKFEFDKGDVCDHRLAVFQGMWEEYRALVSVALAVQSEWNPINRLGLRLLGDAYSVNQQLARLGKFEERYYARPGLTIANFCRFPCFTSNERTQSERSVNSLFRKMIEGLPNHVSSGVESVARLNPRGKHTEESYYAYLVIFHG